MFTFPPTVCIRCVCTRHTRGSHERLVFSATVTLRRTRSIEHRASGVWSQLVVEKLAAIPVRMNIKSTNLSHLQGGRCGGRPGWHSATAEAMQNACSIEKPYRCRTDRERCIQSYFEELARAAHLDIACILEPPHD
jgi:hypothetical protein